MKKLLEFLSLDPKEAADKVSAPRGGLHAAALALQDRDLPCFVPHSGRRKGSLLGKE